MMMMKKRNMLAVMLLGVVTLASTLPATAGAAGAEKLEACLEEAMNAVDPNRARSECMWQHYSYMASYGR